MAGLRSTVLGLLTTRPQAGASQDGRGLVVDGSCIITSWIDRNPSITAHSVTQDRNGVLLVVTDPLR
jgi:hypothetical protein